MLASAGTAQAATPWNATGTQADVVGAWAHGEYWVSGDTSYAKVTITDSQSDGASGRVYFRWRFGDGSTSGAYGPLTASGYQKETTRTYSYPRGALDSYDPFEVKEVRVDNGVEVDWGGWDVPEPFNSN
ncbi:hypothetical protein PS467_41230 [Streptomyces luomodiensis]|uniref:PKD domain-containing protein n=1 Tax=Streptomyces luomodiensis TaxID=3026192 RepID=A0ABY9VH73_9ACTN|nr:hypothetical protein [Streptomyces sp. SCA4-21]WNF01305.1 hypothetical protein PS467_41230 [Streptomyces sp. SCA4-21]